MLPAASECDTYVRVGTRIRKIVQDVHELRKKLIKQVTRVCSRETSHHSNTSRARTKVDGEGWGFGYSKGLPQEAFRVPFVEISSEESPIVPSRSKLTTGHYMVIILLLASLCWTPRNVPIESDSSVV